MPLRDHFHPPVFPRTRWEGFHHMWAVKIVERLNEGVLSLKHRSEPEIHVGSQIEVDVATFDDETPASGFDGANGSGDGGVAVATRTYAPPAPAITADVAFDDPDVFEILVYREDGVFRLVAAVELVSPGNKDRPANRRAFAAKCAAYLQAGVSVVTVDIVTDRPANLHTELADVLQLPGPFAWEPPGGLAVVAYRTVKRTAERNARVRLDVWPHPLAVGAELPTVPLWLAADLAVPLELDRTYEAACRSLRVA